MIKRLRTSVSENAAFLGSMLSLQLVGIFGLVVKIQLMDSAGYHVISRSIGLTDGHELPLLTVLSLFREDVLVNLILIPVGMLAFIYFLRKIRRSRYLFTTIASSFVLAIIYYIDMYSLANTGTFLSLDMLVDAVRWGFAKPGSIGAYLSISGLVKLILILTGATALAFVAHRITLASRVFSSLMIILVVAGLLFSTVTYAFATDSFPQHASILRSTISSLSSTDEPHIDFAFIDAHKLEKYYQSFIGLEPMSTQTGPFTGREVGSDVLMLVIETTPRAIVDFAENPGDLPGVSKLVDRSFVSSQHFTTYPFTTNAMFAMLSSCYPIFVHRNYLGDIDRHKEFGLMSTLKREGYRTSVYSPMVSGYFADIPLYRLMGSETIYLSPEQPYMPDRIEKATQSYLEELPRLEENSDEHRDEIYDLLYYDLMALEKMKDDIIQWKQSNQRFISLYIPQLSHSPWVDIYGQDELDDRSRSLVLLQLEWVDDIVDMLNQNGWLDNTMILLTSDHGIRTKTEYPDIPAGMTNGHSFNVPLLLYAPNTLDSTLLLESLTSHIDIMPTLLELLDIPRSSYRAQGIPLWDESERTLFFIAGNYFGADAYSDGNHFYMYQTLSELTFRGDDIDFDSESDSILQSEAVRRKIDTLYSISRYWAESNWIE